MMSNWNGTILGPPHVCRQLSALHESCAYFRCRAFMKIVSTMSGSIVVTITPIYPRLCNSYPRSIYLAWTREQGRYLSITRIGCGGLLSYLLRSKARNYPAYYNGRGRIRWRQYLLSSGGTYLFLGLRPSWYNARN